jgi:hypothetical protein
MDRQANELEELDVEGILAFAERVLPSASNLWVQTSLNQKQRPQRLFFPEGNRFDEKRRVGTWLTLPVFNYLSPVSESKKEVVGPAGVEPARLAAPCFEHGVSATSNHGPERLAERGRVERPNP